jgi:hypothetical protein
MRLLRTSRWILLALLFSVIPASSHAGVLISVGFAPPVLPVYVQPPCPEPGWMWTPGYWAYGDDGYYWVPGSWVPAPYEGALWTPPYWGWSGGLYVFHSGYWGRHVGYYGGINYGFGYMGVGFVGGRWHGRDFMYNTAVMRVDNVHVRNVYVDRTIVEHNTIVNERHVSFNGGRDGIRYEARPEERMAMRDQHMAATHVQMEHVQAARANRNFYARNNGGHPQNVVAQRPMGFENHGNQGGVHSQPNTFNNRPQPQHTYNDHGGPNRPEFQNRQPQQQHQPQFQQRGNQPDQRGSQEQRRFEQQPRGNYSQPRGNPQHNDARPAPQERGGGGGHPQHEEKPHR